MHTRGFAGAAILILGVVLLSLPAQAATPSAQKPAAVSAMFDGAFNSIALAIYPFELMPGLLMGFTQDGRFLATYAFQPDCTEGTYTIISPGKIEATVREEVSGFLGYQLETVFTLTRAGNLIFGALRTTDLSTSELTGFGYIVGRHTAAADLKMEEALSACVQ